MALDVGDSFVQLFIDVVGRVGGLEVDFRDGLRRVGRHLGLDDHAKLDVVVAGIDLLPGEEAVDRRILCDAADIGCEEDVRDAEAGQALAPLLADIALDRRDLDGVAHKVRRGDAVWHDVIGDSLHRVERAELAAVGPVAPGGVVFAVEVELHRERREPGRRARKRMSGMVGRS